MRGIEYRAQLAREALAGTPRVKELTVIELARIHRRMQRTGGKSYDLPSLVARARRHRV